MTALNVRLWLPLAAVLQVLVALPAWTQDNIQFIPHGKPRLIVLTDLSNEPDDEESLVRLLVYSDQFELEGLIATTSTWLRHNPREDLIRRDLAAYAQVRPNLVKHSATFPPVEKLLAVTRTGQTNYGMAVVGQGKGTGGSQRIIEVVDRADDRPVWVSVWGGPNTLMQALWDVRASRSPAEVDKFVAKLRVYAISDQDDSGPWLRREFPNLFYIVTPSNPASSPAAEPMVGKAPRYCNPLPMVSGGGTAASGDVTVIRDNGEMNEYTDVAWIEGPWMRKRNGTYYLQYSASGTQWKTYASGYYTAKSPLGPFTYAPNNPLLRRTEGIVTGTAHGSIVEGPDGHLWQFYTIVLNNPPGGRRIGMDPVAFDKDGNMSVRLTDTPQWAPGVVVDPAKDGDSGSVPVSINKVRAMNALSRSSSEQPGRYAAYAVDNSSGTWWEPSPDDTHPTLTLDFGSATRFDVTQLFTIDSARLLFTGGRGFGGRGSGSRAGTPGVGLAPAIPATRTATNTASAPASAPPTDAYQYKIEVSTDGGVFTTVLDRSTNTIVRNTIFEEIPPSQCRLVRLTMINWPRATSLGVMEFTVFGRSSGALPAVQPISYEP